MIARPVSHQISNGISKAINGVQVAFSPLSLFAAGEQGAWYDPSDMPTLFQDAAGTIPVTAAGQPVGMMLDKSGRGNHATQATATSRPILQTEAGKWYLSADGVDDWMITSASVDFTTTNKMTVCLGIRKLNDTTIGIAAELSATAAANPMAFAISAPSSSSGNNFSSRSGGSIITPASSTPSIFPPPISVVLMFKGDISNDVNTLAVNGAASATSSSDQGTGNYGNYPIYLFRRGGATFPFNGNFYGAVIRGAETNAQNTSQLESWMNGKTGAY